MSNKVVFITGTNSGFGYLTAKSVASLGHKVYATMRDTKGKNAARATELSEIENITVLDVTLTDDASLKAAVDTVLAAEGKIDVLVNNAGVSMFGVAESATMEDVQRVFEINTFAPWRLVKLVLPHMRKQADGLIVNVSSGWGRFSAPFSAVYASSKFALEGFTEGLHFELRPLGVDAVIVQPGAFPTEMSQKTQMGSDAAVANEYGALAEYPNKMMAAITQMFENNKPDPQEVADAVVNLINLPKGQRPLRTVADPSTGHITARANQAIEIELANIGKAFGLEDLLK